MGEPEACPICGAGMEPGSAACTACGEDPGAAADPAERVRAGRALDHLFSVLESLRRVYVLLALLLGGVFGTTILLGGHAIRGNTLAMAVVVLLGVSAAAAAVAAWDVYHHPRPWSLLLALLASPLALLHGLGFLAAPSVPGAMQLGLVALGTAGVWYGAIQCLKMGSLLRTHPDLAAARRLRGRTTGSVPEGRASRRMRERSRSADLASRRHAFVYGGAVTAGVLLAASAWWAWRHPAPDAALEGFRASWNAAEWDGIRERFEPGLRDRMGKGLGALLRRRGWDAAPPALAAARVEEAGRGRIRGLFPVGADEVRTDWELREGTWFLTGVRLPER